MARFCTNCGKEIEEGVAFCTECGKSMQASGNATVTNTQPSQPVTQQVVQPVQQTAQQVVQPVQQVTQQQAYVPQQTTPVVDPTSKVVGTGTFFLLSFLFSIPMIGWLICLIVAFIPQNKNLKNYARSVLIWTIIGFIISIILFFWLRWIGETIMEYFNQVTEGTVGSWSEILEQFKDLENLDQFQNTDQFKDIFNNIPVE